MDSYDIRVSGYSRNSWLRIIALTLIGLVGLSLVVVIAWLGFAEFNKFRRDNF